jgi:hypothetical protein
MVWNGGGTGFSDPQNLVVELELGPRIPWFITGEV